MPEAATAAAASDGAAARRPRQLLAFDPGTRRIGVASGNTLLGDAAALVTIDARDADAAHRRIAALVAEWRPDALVVGVPRHPDGAPHVNTRRAERFARTLEARFALPVHRVDERYSTVEALAGGARGDDVDAESAAVILRQHLRDAQDASDVCGAAAAR